eukprot:5448202-Amphidinium_carterae.1
MASRESVVEAVKLCWDVLGEVDEGWQSDHGVVLAAVQCHGQSLTFAAEALKGDPELVRAAVQQNGYALQYATEALKADREVVLAAVQKNLNTLLFAVDDLLEDPSFVTETKRNFHLLKLTLLSGRSTVVAATGYERVEHVLKRCHERLGLADDGATLQLWHGADRVPAYT